MSPREQDGLGRQQRPRRVRIGADYNGKQRTHIVHHVDNLCTSAAILANSLAVVARELDDRSLSHAAVLAERVASLIHARFAKLVESEAA